MIYDCHSLSLPLIIIRISYISRFKLNRFIMYMYIFYIYHLREMPSCMSRCHFCIFHIHIPTYQVKYDFRFCVYSFDVIPIIITIYVVFFIFFRLGTYSSEQAQIAGSTKPLTAQRRRFLHRYYRYYHFHYHVHPLLQFVVTCMARFRYQRNVFIIHVTLILPSRHHVLYNLNVTDIYRIL